MAKVKVKINDNCILCGACAATLPEVFEFKDGKYQPKVEYQEGKEVDQELLKKIQEVAEACPAQAIEVTVE